jgi:hypothetical protein
MKKVRRSSPDDLRPEYDLASAIHTYTQTSRKDGTGENEIVGSRAGLANDEMQS